MDRISEILDGLIKRTEEGKLTWRTTIGGYSFMTSVDTIVVIIREDFDDRYWLSILNDNGETARSLQTPVSYEDTQTESQATPEQAQQLSRLFTLARGSTLNADLTLEKLADSLARR